MKFIALLLSCLVLSCSTEKIKEASTALEAVQLYKLACIQGNFDLAKNYLAEESKSNARFISLQEQYKTNNKQQTAKSDASLIVYSIKQENNATQIILKSNLEVNKDTFYVISQNNKWLVKL